MTLIPCNVYFPVGWNIICLRWYCIYKRSRTAGLRRKCIAQLDAFTLTQLLQRLCCLIKHTSQSPTRDSIIWGSLGGCMKVTWMLTWGQTQPAARSHYSMFVGLSFQHVNPQRTINNCSWLELGIWNWQWPCFIQRDLLYTVIVEHFYSWLFV